MLHVVCTSWYRASFICSLGELFSKSFVPLVKPKSYIKRRNPFLSSKRKNFSWKRKQEHDKKKFDRSEYVATCVHRKLSHVPRWPWGKWCRRLQSSALQCQILWPSRICSSSQYYWSGHSLFRQTGSWRTDSVRMLTYICKKKRRVGIEESNVRTVISGPLSEPKYKPHPLMNLLYK